MGFLPSGGTHLAQLFSLFCYNCNVSSIDKVVQFDALCNVPTCCRWVIDVVLTPNLPRGRSGAWWRACRALDDAVRARCGAEIAILAPVEHRPTILPRRLAIHLRTIYNYCLHSHIDSCGHKVNNNKNIYGEIEMFKSIILHRDTKLFCEIRI